MMATTAGSRRRLDAALDRNAVTPPDAFHRSLDDGTKIGVEMQREADQLHIDVPKPGPCIRNGFNATPAIVTAAVLYVLRCVSGSESAALRRSLRDVAISIPPGLLDPPANDDPRQCAAVVAGNVETSQRIVDVLLGALACCRRIARNHEQRADRRRTFGYYETIGGGSGATAGHAGADAVHTHMTNTRITDPEVLETWLPVTTCIDSRSAAAAAAQGKHRGGDGIVREFEFLKPLVVSLITSRRTKPPYGASGGEPGQLRRERAGSKRVRRPNCRRPRTMRGPNGRSLDHPDARAAAAGDRISG